MLGARFALGQAALGQSEAASNAYTLTGDEGAYVLTGQSVTLRAARTLAVDAGSYTLTGQDATLSRDRRLAGYVGAYTLTGQDLTLRATRTLVASPNTREAATTYQQVGFAALGEVPLGGTDSEAVSAPATTYGLQGSDVTLRRGFSMQADVGAYTLTGQTAGSYLTRAIIAGTGVYTISGQAAPSIITMPAGAGAYVLTGQDVEFNRSSRRKTGYTRVGFPMRARAA